MPKRSAPRYELYYWPGIQGRGEFVRLAFEEAGVPYEDVGDVPAMMAFLTGKKARGLQPFAPPFLKVGDLVIAHTAHILQYLGPRLGLVPRDEASRLTAHQHQLTIADLVTEVHDAHHPIASSLYYEDQRPAARRRTEHFLAARVPKYLGYFESVLARSGAGYLVGKRRSYVDLSLFQGVAGLRYAFPRAMRRIERAVPRVVALHDRVAARPRIVAYVASKRRAPFDEHGLFRHYPALDR